MHMNNYYYQAIINCGRSRLLQLQLSWRPNHRFSERLPLCCSSCQKCMIVFALAHKVIYNNAFYNTAKLILWTNAPLLFLLSKVHLLPIQWRAALQSQFRRIYPKANIYLIRRMNNITAKLPIRSSLEAVTQMIVAVASAHDVYKIQTTPYPSSYPTHVDSGVCSTQKKNCSSSEHISSSKSWHLLSHSEEWPDAFRHRHHLN